MSKPQLSIEMDSRTKWTEERGSLPPGTKSDFETFSRRTLVIFGHVHPVPVVGRAATISLSSTSGPEPGAQGLGRASQQSGVTQNFSFSDSSRVQKQQRKKVVLVVGAGDATGGAVARKFAKEGFVACVVRRHAQALQELVKQIQDGGGEALAFGVDARKEGAHTCSWCLSTLMDCESLSSN